jgi:hypothetical protein
MGSMLHVKKVAAGAAIALLASVGTVSLADAASAAPAQAPAEIDLTQLDHLIIQLQDEVQALAFQLGDVMTNLGQQPGLNEALTALGTVLTGDAIVDIIQSITAQFF